MCGVVWGEGGKEIMLPKGVSGVQLLIIQKSISSPGRWKGKFALFQMPASGWVEGRVVDICPKADSLPTLTTRGCTSFHRQK